VLEFDPFIAPTATASKEARDAIYDDIKKSRHYENKVVPLAAGGDDRVVRVLVMLLRDLPTSYTKGAGTLRFEIWQYTASYGPGSRSGALGSCTACCCGRRNAALDLVWAPALGAVEVKEEPVTVRYRVPGRNELKKIRG